jgi:peptidoglycan/LPS O-acetylase OafA/YrhL
MFGVILVPDRSWLYVLTYTVNFAPFPPFPWVLIHLWSLSVEEQFYFLWPLVMKSAGTRTCAAVAIIAILANPIVHVAHRLGGPSLPGYGPFPLVCGPIAMGCLLAMNARMVRSRIVSSKIMSDNRVLLLTVLLVFLFDAYPFGYQGAPAVFLGIITNSLLTLCIARLVFIPTCLAGRVLNSAPFVIVGKLSYSLYLWQQLFLRPDGHAPIVIQFPGNFLAAFAAASACYWGLEVRFLGLRKKFRTQPQSVVSVHASEVLG